MSRSIARYIGTVTATTTVYTVPANKMVKVKFNTGLSSLEVTNSIVTDTGSVESKLQITRGGSTITLISAVGTHAAYILPGTTGSGYLTMQSNTTGT